MVPFVIRHLSHARERIDDTTQCILCEACTTSCPVHWSDGRYSGPQAVVGAHGFVFDARDEGTDPPQTSTSSRAPVARQARVPSRASTPAITRFTTIRTVCATQ